MFIVVKLSYCDLLTDCLQQKINKCHNFSSLAIVYIEQVVVDWLKEHRNLTVLDKGVGATVQWYHRLLRTLA